MPSLPSLTDVTTVLSAVVAHAILWVGLAGTFYLIQQAIWIAQGVERLLRAAAFLSAPLLLLTATGLGMSFPEAIYQSLSVTNPISLGVFGFLLPGAFGVLLAWFFIRGLRRDDDVAVRVMILVSTAVMFQFGEIYGRAVSKSGSALGPHLLPNATFTLGLFLYSVLYYRPGRVEQTGDAAEATEAARDLGPILGRLTGARSWLVSPFASRADNARAGTRAAERNQAAVGGDGS